MPEIVYFEDAFARISNAWFVFRRGAYRVEDTQSVTRGELFLSDSVGFGEPFYYFLPSAQL